jgi:hypothetical protein
MTKQNKVWQFVKMARGLLVKAAELENGCECERIQRAHDKRARIEKESPGSWLGFGSRELEHDALEEKISTVVNAIDDTILN